MTLVECFDAIESHQTSARVNVASTFAAALKLARKERTVEELAAKMGDGKVTEQVLMRVLNLVLRATDIRYENPYDTALLIYTLLLSERSEGFGLAASALVSQATNLWWSAQLATEMLKRSPQRVPADVIPLTSCDVFSAAGFESGDLLFVPDVRGIIAGGAISSASIWNLENETGLLELSIPA